MKGITALTSHLWSADRNDLGSHAKFVKFIHFPSSPCVLVREVLLTLAVLLISSLVQHETDCNHHCFECVRCLRLLSYAWAE